MEFGDLGVDFFVDVFVQLLNQSVDLVEPVIRILLDAPEFGVEGFEVVPIKIVFVDVLAKVREVDFVDLFRELEVEFEEDMIELLQLVRQPNNFEFKISDLWYTFLVKLFEVVVFGESLEVFPDTLSIINF